MPAPVKPVASNYAYAIPVTPAPIIPAPVYGVPKAPVPVYGPPKLVLPAPVYGPPAELPKPIKPVSTLYKYDIPVTQAPIIKPAETYGLPAVPVIKPHAVYGVPQ